jgi:von Willebrand factor type A domain
VSQQASLIPLQACRKPTSASKPSIFVKTNTMQNNLFMQKKTYYHIILDQSGSMQDCIDTTISGFNEQLQVVQSMEERFPEQEVIIGLTRFNDEIMHTYTGQKPGLAQPLDRHLYVPRGSTALLDAIGKTVLKLQTADEVQDGQATVVVVIITDGYENASRLFTLPAIRNLISELEETGRWTFNYLGATLDAMKAARNLHIKPQNSMSFNKAGIKEVFDTLGSSLSDYMEEKKLNREVTSFLKKPKQ